MKKLILALAIMISGLSFAQPGGKEKRNPEEMIEKQVKQMTASLTLSNKQQAEMKTLLTEQSKRREAKRAEMKKVRESGAKPSDEQKAQMKKKMIDEQLAMKTEMKKILTEEQLKKWEENRKEKGKELREKRKEGKRPTEK